MKALFKFASILPLVLMLSACADRMDQNTYNASEVGHQSTVEFGKIVAVHKVKIKGDQTSGVGTVAGATGGGFASSNVGGGGGNTAAIIGGAILGGIIGNAVEKKVMERDGLEYIITENGGKTVSIVQNISDEDQPLHVGQRVMVQTSKRDEKLFQRVLPADNLPTEIKRPEKIKVKD